MKTSSDIPWKRCLLRLSSVLESLDVPLVMCRSYGFIGLLRLCISEHTIVESHPDNTHDDLRLDRPFPGLQTYCDCLHLDSMNSKEHSHTPWLVVIYKYLELWKQQHDGNVPKNYKEKVAFKELIRDAIRKNKEGIPKDEENFDEAIKHVNTALLPTRIPAEVQALFTDERCTALNTESRPFWILIRALHEYVQHEGQGYLPLRGSIPDMTADSERYIGLQNVYKAQAEADVHIVNTYVQQLLERLGRPQDTITEQDVKLFCRNASFLRVVRCRSLVEEYNPASANTSEIGAHVPAEEGDDDDGVHYVLLRAVARFEDEYHRSPGSDNVESDILKLKGCVSQLLQDWGVPNNVHDDLVHEYCRYGGCELHSIAAYMGGVAAQEVIKVLTKQFVPINNTYIYNAMKQTSVTLRL